MNSDVDPSLLHHFDGEASEHYELAEQVYACMETGNIGKACTLIEEYAALHPEKAEALRVALVRDYGQGL